MSATVFYNAAAELATVSNVFRDSGTPTDPTTVSLKISDPAGVQTAYSSGQLTHTGPGAYEIDIPCNSDVDGTWVYAWTATGTASDVAAGTWTTSTTALNQFYCSVEELKSRLQIDDNSDDFEVTLAVQAGCRSIDEICGRYFWRGTDTRTYVPESLYGQQLDDIVSVSTLKVDFDGDGVFEQTWTQGTDYALTVSPGKYNAAAKGEQWPYTGIQIIAASKYIPFVWPWSHQDRIQVTGVFGWPAVPLAVKQASLIAAADLFKIKDAPFGVAGFGEFGVVRVQANPRVMSLLRRYISGSTVGV